MYIRSFINEKDFDNYLHKREFVHSKHLINQEGLSIRDLYLKIIQHYNDIKDNKTTPNDEKLKELLLFGAYHLLVRLSSIIQIYPSRYKNHANILNDITNAGYTDVFDLILSTNPIESFRPYHLIQCLYPASYYNNQHIFLRIFDYFQDLILSEDPIGSKLNSDQRNILFRECNRSIANFLGHLEFALANRLIDFYNEYNDKPFTYDITMLEEIASIGHIEAIDFVISRLLDTYPNYQEPKSRNHIYETVCVFAAAGGNERTFHHYLNQIDPSQSISLQMFVQSLISHVGMSGSISIFDTITTFQRKYRVKIQEHTYTQSMESAIRHNHGHYVKYLLDFLAAHRPQYLKSTLPQYLTQAKEYPQMHAILANYQIPEISYLSSIYGWFTG
jgi:hypothetical protein